MIINEHWFHGKFVPFSPMRQGPYLLHPYLIRAYVDQIGDHNFHKCETWNNIAYLSKFYTCHVETCTQFFKTQAPNAKFLIYNVKQGWPPLTKILNLPATTENFPKINDTNSVQKIHKILKLESYFLAACLATGFSLILLTSYWKFGFILAFFPKIYNEFIFDDILFDPKRVSDPILMRKKYKKK